MRRWLRDSLEPWESVHIEAEETAQARDGPVLIGTLIRARGRASGVETELRFWTVFWFADGKIKRRRAFGNRNNALEAAGLAE
jgi:hypothetical protein